MDARTLGPIHEAIYGPPGAEAPPPLVLEWEKALPRAGDCITFWGGAWRRDRQKPSYTSWIWFTIRTTDDDEADPDSAEAPGDVEGIPEFLSDASAAGVERMLTPLAHATRIQLMQALYEKSLASAELAEATGLRGGNLYYHLKELIHAHYVREQDGQYSLTGLGCQLLITVTSIAVKVVEDAQDEGLIIGSPS